MIRSLNPQIFKFSSVQNWQPHQLVSRFGFLAYVPTGPILDATQKLGAEFNFSRRLLPHATLSQPLSEAPTEKSIEKLKDAIAQIRAFLLRVGPAIPSPDGQMLWLDVWPQERLMDVRETLHSLGLFRTDLPLTKNFMFHMTISDSKREPKEIDGLVKQINQSYQKTMETFFSDIKWVVPNDDFKFEERLNFRLSQSAGRL